MAWLYWLGFLGLLGYRAYIAAGHDFTRDSNRFSNQKPDEIAGEKVVFYVFISFVQAVFWFLTVPALLLYKLGQKNRNQNNHD